MRLRTDEVTIATAAPGNAIPRIGGAVLMSLSVHVSVFALAVVASLSNRRHELRFQLDAGDASPPATAAVQLVASISDASPVPEVVIPQVELPESETATSGMSPAGTPDARQPISRRQPQPRPSQGLELRARRHRGPAPGTERSSDTSVLSMAALDPLSCGALHPPRLAPALTKAREETEFSSPEPISKTRPKRRRVKPASMAVSPAIAAIASRKSGVRIATPAQPLPSNVPPVFPPAALSEGRSGRLVLHLDVDAAGSVADIRVHRSSGHGDLDRAAVNAVRKWRFTPALESRRTGADDRSAPATEATIPVAQTIAVPVSFEFDG